MVHLLKEKSKVHWKQKDRKKYKPLKVELGFIPPMQINLAAEMQKKDQIGIQAYLADLEKSGQEDQIEERDKDDY